MSGIRVLVVDDSLLFREILSQELQKYLPAGCVAGTANVLPKLVVEIYEKYMAGDWEGSREAQFRLSLFRNAYSLGSFPIVPKDALNILGVNVGHPIRPIQHMTEENQEKLRGILKELGMLQ
jgi:4-hydroxy-tetrahydrodipicolinate synthase